MQALGQVVNAASNFEISIGDTAALIAEVMNADVEISTDEQRLRPDGSEVNRLYGDNTRLLQPHWMAANLWRSGGLSSRFGSNGGNGSVTLATWSVIALALMQCEI